MKLTITAKIIIKRAISFTIQLKFKAFNAKIDKIIAGRVNKSPNAAIIGLVMLSGSQPCSKLLNETSMVIGSIIRFEITPAITQIIMKSTKSIEL